MKKLLINNWRAKLLSLLMAFTVWYLIYKHLAAPPPPSELWNIPLIQPEPFLTD